MLRLAKSEFLGIWVLYGANIQGITDIALHYVQRPTSRILALVASKYHQTGDASLRDYLLKHTGYAG